MPALPATEIHTVGGNSYECITAGVGKPSVVLINGSGGPIQGWHKVFSILSIKATTFAYNRPGVGASTQPLRPQTATAMVEDLRNLLLVVPVPPPWLLVGHSYGGLIANLFVRLHPRDVAGVVMLEATAPDDVTQLRMHENGLQRAVGWLATKVFPLNPNNETLHALKSVSEIAAAPSFPPLPLRVITGIKPAMAWATRAEMLALRAKHQSELARLSPLGVQLLAAKSGHFPQFTEPELITSTIQELIAAAP